MFLFASTCFLMSTSFLLGLIQEASESISQLPVFFYVPASLQLSAVLCEGSPHVPGVPRGVVAHSSGSRSHDTFCRGKRDTEVVAKASPPPWSAAQSLTFRVWPALTGWYRTHQSPLDQTWSLPPGRLGQGLWAFFLSGRWCIDDRSYHTGRAPGNQSLLSGHTETLSISKVWCIFITFKGSYNDFTDDIIKIYSRLQRIRLDILREFQRRQWKAKE